MHFLILNTAVWTLDGGAKCPYKQNSVFQVFEVRPTTYHPKNLLNYHFQLSASAISAGCLCYFSYYSDDATQQNSKRAAWYW